MSTVLLKALQVQLGKSQGRFGQQHGDELLGHVEDQTALSSVTWAVVTAVWSCAACKRR